MLAAFLPPFQAIFSILSTDEHRSIDPNVLKSPSLRDNWVAPRTTECHSDKPLLPVSAPPTPTPLLFVSNNGPSGSVRTKCS